MWCKDVINVLGGRFKGRAEVGWDSYDYTLPTGDVVTLRPREVWQSGELCGTGSDSLWLAFGEKVQNRERQIKEDSLNAEKKSWENWLKVFEQLSQFLQAESWGECTVKQGTSTEYYPYPTLDIVVDGRSEVWAEFGKNAELLRGGCKAGSMFTGMPSYRKMAKKRYQYEEKK